ncbi:MAG: DUF2442 domain-containing protein [Kiritimatiellia bacterium]|jgi:hypothetical protein|nr:DUF2442 domain-containing protein [Kiritimatiellia bacterium]MDP6630664.1 DUF2442 domain-containing protein [Kiritimatiellia bacterium]MDP6809473.1 DUF2442 domain-containing protein [Kiritimatiellia bacterium]MDP7023850.1 DUF2442 domain-containing protein [Kiritimatiellia bacterium]
MHYITGVSYEEGYTLRLVFEDGSCRRADLRDHLDGEVFEPLRNPEEFRSAHLNEDIDTVVWDNGADMSPDFLYEISEPVEDSELARVAETEARYGNSPAAGSETGH